MKKFLLSIAMVVAGAAAYAQVNQGNIMLGGTVFFESRTAGTTFGLGVNGGYFIKDGLAVGGNLGFIGEDKAGTRGGNKSEINLGVYGRKYMELGAGFYMYGNVGFDFMMIKDPLDNSNNGFRIAAQPGFAWFPNPKWCIHMSMGDWIYFQSYAGASSLGLTPQIAGLGLSVNYFLSKTK